MGVLDIVPAGVVSGKDVYKVFDYARQNKFAIPAFNVTVSTAFGSRKWCLGTRTASFSRAAFCDKNLFRFNDKSRINSPCWMIADDLIAFSRISTTSWIPLANLPFLRFLK